MGLGGIQPNGMALMGEYSPRTVRILLMMIVSNGFNIGAAFGGLMSAALIPAFGWRSVFYFGGIVPLAIAVLMFFLLPESLQFLVLKRAQAANVRKWLQRIAPHVPSMPPRNSRSRRSTRGRSASCNCFKKAAPGNHSYLGNNYMNLLNIFLLASCAAHSGEGRRILHVHRGPGWHNAAGGSAVSARWPGLADQTLRIRPVLSACFLIACVNVALIGKPGLIRCSLLFAVVFVARLVHNRSATRRKHAVRYVLSTNLRFPRASVRAWGSAASALYRTRTRREMISAESSGPNSFLAASSPH